MSIPIKSAQLVGLFTESALWGIHLLTATYCAYALLMRPSHLESSQLHHRHSRSWRRRAPSRVSCAFFGVTVVLFVIGTLDIAMGLKRCLHAFVWAEGPAGADEVFGDIDSVESITKVACFWVMTMICDLVLIYRTYIVFSRRFIVILPLLLCYAGYFACAVYILNKYATLNTPTLLATPEVFTWSVAGASLTMGINVIATGLIIWRIYSVDSSVRRYQNWPPTILSPTPRTRKRQTALQRTIRIFADSALVYCLTFVVLMVVFVLENNSYYVVSDMGVQIGGICFDVIIIRIHSGRALFSSPSDSFSSTGDAAARKQISTLRFGTTTATTETDAETRLEMGSSTRMVGMDKDDRIDAANTSIA